MTAGLPSITHVRMMTTCSMISAYHLRYLVLASSFYEAALEGVEPVLRHDLSKYLLILPLWRACVVVTCFPVVFRVGLKIRTSPSMVSYGGDALRLTSVLLTLYSWLCTWRRSICHYSYHTSTK